MRGLRWAGRGLLLLLAVAAGVLLAAWLVLRASLPLLDGDAQLAGLHAPVSIDRDALGVPTLRGRTRQDLARATGFLHAQERFFQMDLLRRSAAGELAVLFGAAALPLDRRLRPEQLRAAAQRALAAQPEGIRALIAAYAEGVNAGLDALGSRPFEYWLLRTAPEPWREADSLLVVLAMFLDLTDRAAQREVSDAYLRAVLGEAGAAFVAPRGGPWDAPLLGDALPAPRVPDDWPHAAAVSTASPAEQPVQGSNNWAVASAVSRHGGAIVADDMHLGLRLPNIWYRLRLVLDGPAPLDVTGVSLPGLPAIVAGSNGQVAWGFTNSYGDWSDIVLLDEQQVRSGQAELQVRGGPPEVLDFETSDHGPVTRDPVLGSYAVQWLARTPGGLNLDLVLLEQARTIDEARAVANRAGMPPQNIVLADAAGHIAWTIAGRIPNKVGFDPLRPARWGVDAGWQGWLDPADYPAVIDPADHRLWTANSRVVDGDMLAAIGDGGYALGARGQQIRDGLRARETLDETDVLEIVLDDRALFLQRWQTLMRAHSDEPRLRSDDLAAHTDSQAYLLVKRFRAAVADAVHARLVAPVLAEHPDAPLVRSWQFEHSLWATVQARPAHLLPAGHADWDAFLTAMADRAVADTPAGQTWGAVNAVAIGHPMADVLPPLLARHLRAPSTPQAGDRDMPRVAGPSFGASERFAVSPGREEQGFFTMPGGQSGHPLSPHFLAGHDDWLAGRPAPFLPGATEHTLTLTP